MSEHNKTESDEAQTPDYVEVLNCFFRAIGEWSADHRWWVILIGLFCFTSSILWATRVHIDMSFEAFFEASDPTYLAYQQYRSDFGSDEVSYILYEAPNTKHGPFDIEIMAKIAKLTNALEAEVPFVAEVTSLANVEIMEAIADGIDVHELLEEFPDSQQELLKIRDLVLNKPMLVGGMFSADKKFAAIIIEMEKSAVDPPEALKYDPDGGDWIDNSYPQVSARIIDEILARPEYAQITFYHGGDVPWNATFNNIAIPQTMILSLATYTVIGIMLALFFRRIRSVIGPFIVVTIAITVSVGIIGVFDWDLDMMFPFVPNLLIAIGVADSVHIISEFNEAHRRLGCRREAISQTMYLVGTPCLLTSLTTAAGLLAMSFSNIKAMSHLAIYSAGGILGAFFFSVTLLMTFFAFGERGDAAIKKAALQNSHPDKKNRIDIFIGKLLSSSANIAINHPKLILAITAVIFASSLAGLSQLKVDNNFIDEWREDEPIRQITLKIDDTMGGMGMGSIIYLFDTKHPDGIKNPKVLQEIERVQALAESQTPYVKKSYSIVDVIKDLNRSFHNDDPAYYKIPKDRELIAQLLLIYEMSGGENLEEYVSADFSRANLNIVCRMEAISSMIKLAEHIGAELDNQPLEYSSAEITGIGALWMRFADYIAQSQIQSISLAFIVIAIMMCIIFKSVKIGLLTMIPNLTPVLLTLGYMGWVGMELDYTRLLIAPLAIGIAVDDTIHLVARFHIEFRRLGNYAQALRNSIQNVGRALIITTAILVLGFIVNVFHGMEMQVVFGKLVAWTIFTALVADLLLMPALILVFKPFGPETSSTTAQNQANFDSKITVENCSIDSTIEDTMELNHSYENKLNN